MADNTIDNLSIQVTASAEEASRVFDRLASNAGKLKGATSGAAQGMRDLGEAAKDMGMTTSEAAEQSGESVQNLARNIESVNKKRYSAASAGVFAYLKKDSEVLGMKLDAAKARLADLLNADTPNNRAIANATAEVKRLQDAFVKAKKAEEEFAEGSNNADKSARKAASGIKVFWESLKRIAFYRAVRGIIKGITEAFGTGISNLYQWSKILDGHFAASMDRLATSTLYLKNSLGAMVSPLIESLVPVLDIIIDKVVEILNFFNMLISAVSGADTYTVAKKVATVWEDAANKTKKSAKSASDDIKRTILGFDEINKLVKPNSTSGSSNSSNKKPTDYKSMFEERPLTGIFRDIANVTKGWPDWLKWLLGIGGGVAAAWGISQLPKLLKNIFDWLKRLFTIKLPDWFKWFFGPKGNKDIDIDLPDDFKLPDADITTNIKKGDWSALDNLSGKSVYLSPKLDNKPDVLLRSFISAWMKIEGRILYFTPRLDNKARVLYDSFVSDWNAFGSKILYFTPRLDNRAKVLYNAFKNEWDVSGSKTLYFTPKLNNKASVLANQFKKEWNDALATVYVGVVLEKDGWKNIRAWLGLDDPVTANINLRKWGWNYMRTWLGLDDPHTANINLRRWGWSSMRTWLGLDNAIDAAVNLVKWGWDTISEFVGTWVDVNVNLEHGNFFDLNSWVGNWVDVGVYLYRGNFWSLADWVGDSVTVRVNLVMGSGGVINVPGGRSSGSGSGKSRSLPSASGGGGGAVGGGAYRGRRANGGILSHGVWSNIPKYAGGTSGARGTMFIAGEAGPEVVGHIGGRTEVLNKSQLASAMYSAVQAAMAPAAANFAAAANYLQSGNNAFDMEMLAEMVRQGVESAMERQGDIQRQQLDTLRQINAKDFSTEISTASINKAQARINRRAGMTITPVTQ